MENNIVNPIVLYELYFTKDINNVIVSEINENIVPRPKIEIEKMFGLESLSPIAKKIYNNTSERDKPRILKLLIEDTKKIIELENAEYKNDSDYIEKFENNGLGFYVEKFISMYGICPVCKQKSLKKYNHSNMPVVDLICTNKNYHDINGGCIFYQVKTSTNDMYFNIKQKYVMVGSKKFGYNSHIINAQSDIKTKILLVGYICIFMEQNINDTQKYKINKKKSFVLIPDFLQNINENYYNYGNPIMNKNTLRWNDNLVNIYDMNICLDKTEIDTTQQFEEFVIRNPYINYPYDKLGIEWVKHINNKNKNIKNII